MELFFGSVFNLALTKQTKILNSVQIIRAGNANSWQNYLRSVAGKAGLIFTLAKRDVQIKYAQSLLGVFWVLIQPLAGVALFTLVVSHWLKLPAQNYPYPLFAFTGIVVWNFFSYMVTAGGTSLTDSRQLIHRLSFPKIVLPLSKIVVGLLDCIIALVLLFVVVLFTGVSYSVTILMLPLFLFFLILTGLSVSLWLAALTIRFRDFYHIIPYVINFGIWITPVFYPLDIVPAHFRLVVFCNPVAMAVEGFRWCFFGSYFSVVEFIPSILLVMILLISGLFYFRSVESKIADTI